MMVVKVRFPAHIERFFSQLASKDLERLEIPEGTTVAGLLQVLGLAQGEIGLVLINGKQADLSTLLEHGDEVELYLPLAGG